MPKIIKISHTEKSKYLKVKCPRCKSEQMIFGKSAMQIKCPECNRLLTKTTGGKTKIRALITKVLWR
ncbi:30S ribosomal protein S27e [Candidatus Pacearchaeota archaeon]|nr:30S ribosomal protein S27e [Candidatus Pacearchaeota archaeon]|tara:strand:+ start:224 stop:424 length:201 start_codon:yes stop_codon:yes gene_type:complete